MADRAPALRVFRRRDFRLLFAGQAVSVLGDRMVAVALAFAVLEAGGSLSAVGLVLACAALPLLGTVLIGGVVADRMSRRGVMVVADLVRVGSQGAMAALLISGTAEIWMLATLAGVTGAATGFFHPAATGLLTEVVPADELQPANALRATALSVGEVLGPLAAGVLVAATGAGWAIAADAGTFAVSALCLARLRPTPRAPAAPATFLADLRGGWEAFRSRRWVWTTIAYFALANMMWGAWSALGPVVADRDLGGPAAWGTVLAAMGVGALAGSLVAVRVEPRRPLLMVAAAEAMFVLPLAFLAAGTSVPLLALAALSSGAGMMIGNTVFETTLQRHIPGESLSRVTSYDWFGSLAFFPLGLALWGPVAVAIGISASLWVAFAAFAAALLLLVAIPDVRHLPAEPAGAGQVPVVSSPR